jgi:ATP-dependent Clp protease ATP-binding subunit ClpC
MVELGADVRALLAQAQRVAQKRGQKPSTGHIVLAMLESPGDGGRLLGAHGARVVALHGVLRDVQSEASNTVDLSLDRARRIAAQSGARKAHPLHLLLATLQNTRSEAARCLDALGVPVDELSRVLEDSLGMPSPRKAQDGAARVRAEALKPLPRTLIDWEAQKRSQTAAPTTPVARIARAPHVARAPRGAAPGSEAARSANVRAGESGTPGRVEARAGRGADSQRFVLDPQRFALLHALGRNLTQLAAEGRIDPVVGRDQEIEQVLDVLARRRANNPILVGPPGVGKTAIAEGLALRLVAAGLEDEAAPRLLIEVSAGSLVSGTGVRGALSEKLARLRKEVRDSEGRVLLFLDEIHALISGNDGPDDLANELKAALARGELPCLGATTEVEYRRVFERDAALCRRFSRVEVLEPSRDAALSILQGVSLHYERFHGVAYARDALQAAVDLSVRYLPEQHLPDKAIAVLDLSAARVRRRGGDVVDRAAVAAVIGEQAQVPVERLLMRDKERLLTLEARLSERVIGQRASIARIADAVRRGAVGLRGKRPLGVFLLLGPTGVGKTELAKALSDELFERSGMTRIDMSELGEAHAVARLFGAPPGYVGHEDGGQLTEAVRKRPYQLVLLDEIEKAHPDVLLSLLPLLDEGRLTDGRGRTIDFTNTIIVLTSNLGARESAKAKVVGFGADDSGEAADDGAERALRAVRAALPPELWNRMDEVVFLPRLSRADVALIARRMLAFVVEALRREQGVEVEIDDSVIDALIEAGGYDAELGARPMRRVVGRAVESLLASALLEGRMGRGERVRLEGREGRIVLSRPSAGPSTQSVL